MSAPTTTYADRPFGARFLDEFFRAGGPRSIFKYDLIQALRASDREGMIQELRRGFPLSVSHAHIRRIRESEDPEGLAREILKELRTAATVIAVMLIVMMSVLALVA